MYYKILKNNKVIDILNNVIYFKHQKKNNLIVSCKRKDAEGIISSDNNVRWYVAGFNSPKEKIYDTVELVEIDEYEYNQLKRFNYQTPEELIDAYTLMLIEGGLL